MMIKDPRESKDQVSQQESKDEAFKRVYLANSSEQTYLNNSSFKFEAFLDIFGGIVLTIGICVSLYIGLTLKTARISEFTNYIFSDPHPMRWWYALGISLSTIYSSSIIFALSKILNHLKKLNKNVV